MRYVVFAELMRRDLQRILGVDEVPVVFRRPVPVLPFLGFFSLLSVERLQISMRNRH